MSNLNTEFSKQINKSPNELEQDVAAYISSSKNQEMDEVIAKDSRMQVWHLLSDLRTGLVSWYDFKEDAEVLEIGAGFGALTGVLCEKCKSVTVTERSLFRAEQISKRYETVENLNVYAGDVLDIQFEKKFDYIVLAGLLEIIGKGTSNLKIYADYLSKLKSYLKEDGKLLVAVENRMGLKYFCGATETYTNKAFAGINHYKQGGRGYTFTKKELEYADNDNANSERHLANFWAAREACLKALGTGFGDDIAFSDVSVVHNDFGKPEILIAGGAKAVLKELAGGDAKIHLSITDQDDYCAAMVVIESK